MAHGRCDVADRRAGGQRGDGYRAHRCREAGRCRRRQALLAKKVDVNAPDADTSTPLDWAVQSNNLEIVNLLIDAGANVNAETRYKITPLSLACTNGNAAIIERLLKAGVDPNGTSEEGQTALMTAALNGKVDAIKVLLSHGAKVNAIEPFKGQTALMWAAGEGNSDAAALLIEFGGDVKAKSKAGFTPLLFAVMNNQITGGQGPAGPWRERRGPGDRRQHDAEHGHHQRLLRHGIGASGPWRRPQRAGSQWNAAALAGVDAQTRHVVGSGGHGHGSDYRSASQRADE